MIDSKVLFDISYGLYVVTVNDGVRDGGCIVNTVTQLTSSPLKVAVCINRANYSHDVIKSTGKMNINCLSVKAPFALFEKFGFQSGRDAEKFKDITPSRSENGLAILPENITSFISLSVDSYTDLGTHGMFICTVTETGKINDDENMTYTYYHKNVKPKPKTDKKRGYVCKICGYVYEGEELPPDFICPLCKHGAEDFEAIE